MKYAQIEWNNGTPRSACFDDVYFSQDNGLEETRHVFLQQNELPRRWQQAERFVIAETGFGTGLNFLVTCEEWLRSAPPDARLHYISIENRPVRPDDIARLAARWRSLDTCVAELLGHYPPPVPGMHRIELAAGRVSLNLILDEVEAALSQINYPVDAWYLDGFAPSRNPDMWTPAVFELIGRNTRAGGSFATYTAAGQVRRGLEDAGFVVQKVDGYGAKRSSLKGFIVEQRCYTVEQPWYAIPRFSAGRRRAAIVGAGLSGLTVALALCRRGWRVSLVDQHPALAQGASGNPAGLLMPRLSRDDTLDSRFYVNAYVHAIQCLDRLQAGSNRRFWFKTGNLLVDSEGKLGQLAGSERYPEELIRYIDRSDTGAIVGTGLDHDALLLPQAGWVDVKQLCERLAAACGGALEFLQGDVADIRYAEGCWHLLGSDKASLAVTDCVVVANGHAAGRFSALEWMPVESSRGQITRVAETPASRNIVRGISADRYITPAHKGEHVIGASYDRESTSTDLSARDQADNINGINRLLHGCVEAPAGLAGRAAFRAVSRDRVPLVGCVPDSAAFAQQYRDLHHGRPSTHYPAGTYLPGLYVSTAHGSRGLCSCFISGDIVAAMICGEPAPVEKKLLDYLNPARFLVRRLKRGRC
jgi:tRNA 5-methylaminomethyl-2-thiouridine biosynthesis bifunctional protein